MHPYREYEPSLAYAFVLCGTKLYDHDEVPSSQDGFARRLVETSVSVQVTPSVEPNLVTASPSRAQRAIESHQIEGAMLGPSRERKETGRR